MEYRIDSKKVRINEGNLKLLGSGIEGNVYKYRDYALKIKSTNNLGLSYEDAKYMIGTRTNKILLPKGILYINNRYSGYVTKYVSSIGNYKLIDLTKEELINTVILPIEEDILSISSKNILINDLKEEDTIINELGLYILDPGSFTIMRDIDEEDIKKLNILQVKELIDMIVNLELKRNKLNNLLDDNISDILSDYYESVLPKNVSIKEYVKK